MELKINDATLNIFDGGNHAGLPVVFLHGFPFSHRMWEPQLHLLSRDYRTVAYDIRGHGSSDAGDGLYTIELFVDDLFNLLEYLKIDQTIVVGLSMGGYIALRALERAPKKFRAAVLCDTRSESDGNEVKLKRAAAIARVKREGSSPFASDFVKTIFAPTTLKGNPKLVERIRRGIEVMSPLAIAGTQLALAARTDTTESLSRISVPAMILVGEHDSITTPDVCRRMHQRITGSEYHVVPDAAHLSNLENPGFFNDRLGQFLANVE